MNQLNSQRDYIQCTEYIIYNVYLQYPDISKSVYKYGRTSSIEPTIDCAERLINYN